MGWYGLWNIVYNGKNNEKFLNVAKLVIPNFEKRFESFNNNSELEAVRNLSWYTADKEIEKILSYLEDGDEIRVLIDGETHPIREIISEGRYEKREGEPNENDYDWMSTNLETGEVTYGFTETYIEPVIDYCDFEEQTYKKQDGKISMYSEYVDNDRDRSEGMGIRNSFIYDLAHPDSSRRENKESGYGDVLDIDTYIAWIAREMGDNEEMMPIIHDFMNEVMDISKDEVIEQKGVIDEETFAYFNDIKNKFKTLEETKAYLSDIKSKLPPKKEKAVLPDLFANMSKRDIARLGGVEKVTKLYENDGEQKTIELLAVLGYDLNSGLKEKRKSSIAIKREKNEVNKKITKSVTDYFLGFVKNKYPNITPQNEKIFIETLEENLDHRLEYAGYTTCVLYNDWDPCDELASAFYSMDMSNFDSGLPIYDVFPSKTSVVIEPGKCAKVNSDFEKSQILYITDDYKEDLLKTVNTKIMQEESKIPEDVKANFEEEYQTLMEALNVEREPLAKKQEETQRILDQKNALDERAKELIESYSKRVEELETLGLSEDEKGQRKQAIINEILQIQKAANSDEFMNKLGEIEEKYGKWQTLKEFDDKHKKDLDKAAWMRTRYITWVREESNRTYEKHKEEHPADFFSYPDYSHLPYELDTLYAQKEEITEFERKQEKTTNIENGNNITEQQKEFAQALGNAYAEYMKERGSITEYSFRNNRKQILVDGFSKYFESNFENLTNTAFLTDFEEGPMREITKKMGFRADYSIMHFGASTSDGPHVKVSEGLIYTVDSLFGGAKIQYGTAEAIQQEINRFDNEIRFLKDAQENPYLIGKLETQKKSFVSYQKQLQGEQPVEPTLSELDQQKNILEALDQKTTELLKQHKKSKQNGQNVETDGIDYDD